jgi:hypothetical protein
VIVGDNPDDLSTDGGIVTWEIEAIKISVGVCRRIFFIARYIGE